MLARSRQAQVESPGNVGSSPPRTPVSYTSVIYSIALYPCADETIIACFVRWPIVHIALTNDYVHMQTGTDYGPYLINEAPPLHTTAIVDGCTRRLADTWQQMRTNADTPLSTFLDFCTYGHMIDNVVLIVTGLVHERDVQVCYW